MEIYKCNGCYLECILLSNGFPIRCPLGNNNSNWVKLVEGYKKCIRCGDEFKPRHKEENYCSDICEECDIEEKMEE